MKTLRWLFHFIGSVHFAVTLITCSALYVAIGTFLESASDSHAFASRFTYGHPLFALILWGYFVNILTSALRRWPYRWRHAPFLITHLGLLMILSGTIYKTYFGIQGTMAVNEGCASQEIFVNGSECLQLESPDSTSTFPLYSHPLYGYYADLSTQASFWQRLGLKARPNKGPRVSLIDYQAHGIEDYQLWFKEGQLTIQGLPAFPVQRWTSGDSFLVSAHARFSTETDTACALIAVNTEKASQAIEEFYAQHVQVRILDARNLELRTSLSLQELLSSPVKLDDDLLSVEVKIPKHSWQSLDTAELQFEIEGSHTYTQHLALASATEAIPNERAFLGRGPFIITLAAEPTVLCIQESNGWESLWAIGSDGRMSRASYEPGALPALYILDKGYKGYSSGATLSLQLDPSDEGNAYSTALQGLKSQMLNDLSESHELAAPIQLLYGACEQDPERLVDVLTELLRAMDAGQTWLLSTDTQVPELVADTLEKIDWSSEKDLHKGALWALHLLPEIAESVLAGENPAELLRQRKWPLAEDLKHCPDSESVLRLFTQQLFILAAQLPDPPISTSNNAPLLAICLRAYGLELAPLLHAHLEQRPPKEIELECALEASWTPASPSRKIEDNCPVITVRIEDGEASEIVQLPYDRYGSGLKWPVLDGRYLVRFQPQFLTLPHRLRLRQARQLSYPNSPQAFSYESDIWMSEAGGIPETATLSMNHVYETKDGFRFYMANLYPPDPGQVKQAQIVVNWDPLKYRLTYPGAILMACGSLLLFWRRRRA